MTEPATQSRLSRMGVTPPSPIDDSTTDQIVSFLSTIGLVVRFAEIHEPTVLPGIAIDRGALVVDRTRLLHPGDLLHEAGHLAVLPSAERSQLAGSAGASGGMEMSAIAWSYAAGFHLRLDPAVVFHDDGYRGGAANLIDNFEAGRYIGVPILQWLGLTADPAKAADLGIDHYPHMSRWIVD
jgi:hypothetical protein